MRCVDSVLVLSFPLPCSRLLASLLRLFRPSLHQSLTLSLIYAVRQVPAVDCHSYQLGCSLLPFLSRTVCLFSPPISPLPCLGFPLHRAPSGSGPSIRFVSLLVFHPSSFSPSSSSFCIPLSHSAASSHSLERLLGVLFVFPATESSFLQRVATRFFASFVEFSRFRKERRWNSRPNFLPVGTRSLETLWESLLTSGRFDDLLQLPSSPLSLFLLPHPPINGL
jgi:hypothetical protein